MSSDLIILGAGIVFSIIWLAFLFKGSVLLGGTVIKPIFVKRRSNPVGYAALMILIAAIAVFATAEGLVRLGWLPAW